MANTLFLRFESPLQSWGERDQWMVRNTAPEPTKSGIVGVLACALGWRDDERIATLTREIRVGVRCDLSGGPAPLEDFHTVGGGYRQPQLLQADGKLKYIPNTKIPHTEPTKRAYLNDSSFLAAVRAADGQIGQLAEAVQSPCWPIYLGRKCCVPTRPIFDGVGTYDSLQQALREHPVRLLPEQFATEKRPQTLSCRAVIECEALADGAVRRQDQLISRVYRHFESRYAREVWLDNVAVEWLRAEVESGEGA